MGTLIPLRKEKKEKKMKKLSQFLEVHILEFEMWGTDGGGHLHCKHCPVS